MNKVAGPRRKLFHRHSNGTSSNHGLGVRKSQSLHVVRECASRLASDGPSKAVSIIRIGSVGDLKLDSAYPKGLASGHVAVEPSARAVCLRPGQIISFRYVGCPVHLELLHFLPSHKSQRTPWQQQTLLAKYVSQAREQKSMSSLVERRASFIPDCKATKVGPTG